MWVKQEYLQLHQIQTLRFCRAFKLAHTKLLTGRSQRVEATAEQGGKMLHMWLTQNEGAPVNCDV